MKYRVYHNVAATVSKSKRTYESIDAEYFIAEDGLVSFHRTINDRTTVVFAVPHERVISITLEPERARRSA